jgi:hypothetical protein
MPNANDQCPVPSAQCPIPSAQYLIIKLRHRQTRSRCTEREDHLISFFNDVRKFFEFFLVEVAEHEVHLLAFAEFVADAEAQATVILAAKNELNVF